jgi:hypothetical protein
MIATWKELFRNCFAWHAAPSLIAPQYTAYMTLQASVITISRNTHTQLVKGFQTLVGSLGQHGNQIQ